MASNNSTPAGSSVLTMFVRFSRGHFGKEVLKSGKDVTPGQVSSFGVPSNLLYNQHVYIRVCGFNLLEDLEDLINLRITWKQGLASAHLSEDRTNRPHVHTR